MAPTIQTFVAPASDRALVDGGPEVEIGDSDQDDFTGPARDHCKRLSGVALASLALAALAGAAMFYILNPSKQPPAHASRHRHRRMASSESVCFDACRDQWLACFVPCAPVAPGGVPEDTPSPFLQSEIRSRRLGTKDEFSFGRDLKSVHDVPEGVLTCFEDCVAANMTCNKDCRRG
jgi:hypothetical protein